MRFRLNLEHIKGDMEIPFNYQYLLTGAIYHILAKADGEYATFLHDTGYSILNKTFKLFTFSDLQVSFKPNGDRMRLIGKEASLTISFHLPQAAETFIRGLFLDQEMSLFDRRSKAVFLINQVESLASPFAGQESDALAEYTFSLLSPIVVSKKDEQGKHKYLSPMDADFLPILLGNWKSKYASLYGESLAEEEFKHCSASILFDKGKPKSRLIKIRDNSKNKTEVKGYYNFKLILKGSIKALELVYDSGVGSYNAEGRGCLGI